MSESLKRIEMKKFSKDAFNILIYHVYDVAEPKPTMTHNKTESI